MPENDARTKLRIAQEASYRLNKQLLHISDIIRDSNRDPADPFWDALEQRCDTVVENLKSLVQITR